MKVVKCFFNFCIFLISFLIPKSNKYIIVGGWHGERFADNSKAIYEYLDLKKNELGIKKVFWYTKNKDIYNELKSKNKDVIYGYKLSSIYWHFRSKTHIIDQSTRDIIGILSVRCNRIDLWHGIPLKKIGNYIHGENASNWKDKFYTAGCWPDKYVLAPSEYVAQMLKYAMGIKENKLIIASYPRNEKLYNVKPNTTGEEMNVFYLPTFRDSGDINPLLAYNLKKIDKMLSDNNIKLYIKPHFASAADWEVADCLDRIEILDAKEDVYMWLDKMDILITDYSSVYFDYLLTGRPVLFFPYDYTNYSDVERGFTMPYMDNTPGEKVYTVDELLKTITEIKSNYTEYIDKYKMNYEETNNKVNKFTEGPNYDELIKVICCR